jgi:hypothetical protein
MALPPRKPGSSGLSRGIGPGASRAPAARTSGLNRGVPNAPAGGNFAAPSGPPVPPVDPQNDHQVFVNNDEIETGNPAPAPRRPGTGQSGLRARTSGLRAGISGPRQEIGAPRARTSGLRAGVPPGASSNRRAPKARRATSNTGLFGGVGGIVIILILVTLRSGVFTSGNVKYMRATGKLVDQMEYSEMSASARKKKLEALPISGVTDPKIKEFHATLIEIVTLAEKAEKNGGSLSEADNARASALLIKSEMQGTELDNRYAGKRW